MFVATPIFLTKPYPWLITLVGFVVGMGGHETLCQARPPMVLSPCKTEALITLYYPHARVEIKKNDKQKKRFYLIAAQPQYPQKAFLVGKVNAPKAPLATSKRLTLNGKPVTLSEQGFVVMVSQEAPVTLQYASCQQWQVPLRWQKTVVPATIPLDTLIQKDTVALNHPLSETPTSPQFWVVLNRKKPSQYHTSQTNSKDALDTPPVRVQPDDEAFRLPAQLPMTWLPVTHRLERHKDTPHKETWFGWMPSASSVRTQTTAIVYWVKSSELAQLTPASNAITPQITQTLTWKKPSKPQTYHWFFETTHLLPLMWDYHSPSQTLSFTSHGSAINPFKTLVQAPLPCHSLSPEPYTHHWVCRLPLTLKGISVQHTQLGIKQHRIEAIVKLQPTRTTLQGRVIVLDAGHGGKESGAMGMTGVAEKTLNWQVVQKLSQHLQTLGAKVYLTHQGEGMRPKLPLNVAEDLKARVRWTMARDTDVFLSIHHNALPDGMNPYETHGTETYWFTPQSHCLAQTVHGSVVKALGLKDNGIWQKNLAVIRPWTYPSILLELGSMIHPTEYRLLKQASTQTKAVQGITEGLLNYFKHCTKTSQ